MTYETSPIFRRMTLAFLHIEQETSSADGKPGFPPAVGLAVSACESAWWAAQTGKNNYFGITRPPAFAGDPASAWCLTMECVTPAQLAGFRSDERSTAVPIGINRYRMYRWFASYPTLEAAVHAYVHLLIDASRYNPAWTAFHEGGGALRGDADKFLAAVCAAGYATGPAFKVEVQIEHQQNILRAVAAGRAELLANPLAA
jgi:flagellum-specific peptidoglycan hydrolase FlgJ